MSINGCICEFGRGGREIESDRRERRGEEKGERGK
jgi:hypothetical protein